MDRKDYGFVEVGNWRLKDSVKSGRNSNAGAEGGNA